MDGYVVRGTVVAERPRSVALGRPRPPSSESADVADVAITELAGEPLGHALAVRLEHWRVLFAQTTFYLLDADGWR